MCSHFKIATVFVLIGIFLISPASAEKLLIGLGNFEPHFITEGNTGLFTDLVKETFSRLPQYQLDFWHGMSVKRMLKELDGGRIDAGANIFDVKDSKDIYLSEPVFRFTDVAVTLKNKNLVISNLSDLKNKSVITYQGAKTALGPEFEETIKACPDYTEVAEPFHQAKMVAKERYDVSIGDIYVFLHSLKIWSKGTYKPEQFEFHRIFPDFSTRMGFRDKKVCDDFNRALAEIKKDGTYDAVYQIYLRKLGYWAKK